MKTSILGLIFLSIFGFARATPPDPDFAGSRASVFKGHAYYFDLKKSSLAAEPKWDAGCPPLTPKEAVGIATAQLQKLLPEDGSLMDLSSVALERYGGVAWNKDDWSKDTWIYLVTFTYHPPGMWMDPQWTLTIPLYLDGRTIAPRIIAVGKDRRGGDGKNVKGRN